MKQMEVVHPTAKMLVEISKAQDIEAGDGTTSVVVLAGALLEATQNLLDKGIHPTQISESFHIALMKSMEILKDICMPVELTDREKLIECVNTSLSSKVVSGNSQTLSPIAVDSVLRIINPLIQDNVDLRDIKVSKSVSGTIEDTELIDGLIFTNNKISHVPGAPTKIQNPKIALI
jgi:T-complex protein 1 subunit delta